jgi:hypothetical protein
LSVVSWQSKRRGRRKLSVGSGQLSVVRGQRSVGEERTEEVVRSADTPMRLKTAEVSKASRVFSVVLCGQESIAQPRVWVPGAGEAPPEPGLP